MIGLAAIILFIFVALLVQFMRAPSALSPIVLWNFAHLCGFVVPYVVWLTDMDLVVVPLGSLLGMSDEAIERAAIAVSILLILTNIAYFLSMAGPRLISDMNSGTLLNRLVSVDIGPVFGYILIAFVVLSAIGIVLPLTIGGSIEESYGMLASKGQHFVRGQTFLFIPNVIANVLGELLAIYVILRPGPPGRRLLVIGLAVTIIVLPKLALGGRMSAVMWCLTVALAVAYARRVRPSITALTLFAGIILFATSAGLYVRGAGQIMTGVDKDLALTNPIEGFLSSYAILDQFAMTMGLVDRHGLLGMQGPLNYVEMFIPRAIWPEKGEALQIITREMVYGDRLGGLTVGFYGEWMMYFGLAGATIAAVIGGIIIAYLTRAVEACSKVPWSSATITSFVLSFTLSAPRNGFHIVFISMVSTLLIILTLRPAVDLVVSRHRQRWQRAHAERTPVAGAGFASSRR